MIVAPSRSASTISRRSACVSGMATTVIRQDRGAQNPPIRAPTVVELPADGEAVGTILPIPAEPGAIKRTLAAPRQHEHWLG
jgi:hypothetical protein